jgi:hypothetical protein
MNIGKAAILEDFSVMLEWSDRVGYSSGIPANAKAPGSAPPRSTAGQTARIYVNAVRRWIREETTLARAVTFPQSVRARAEEVIQ